MAQAYLERPIDVYVPFFRPGTVFVTCLAVNREPIFDQAATAHLVRTVLRQVKTEMPFQMVGFAILPDHLHLLIRPGKRVSAQQVVNRMRIRYRWSYAELMGSPSAMEVWERWREIELLREVETFAHRLDVIHYDPVHHGLVDRPEEWLESSYGSWIERGLYKLGWGWQRPQRLQGG